MRTQIPIGLLQPGIRLPGTLLDDAGECLVEAGTCLSEADVAKIRACGTLFVHGGDDWPYDPAQAMFDAIDKRGIPTAAPQPINRAPVSEHYAPEDQRSQDRSKPNEAEEKVSVKEFRKRLTESLQSDMCLPHNVYDADGVLLLAAGTQITPRFLQLLTERGIKELTLRLPNAKVVHAEPALPTEPTTLADLQSRATRVLDQHLAGDLEKEILIRPVKAWRRPRLSVAALKAEAVVGLDRHAASSASVADICDRLQRAQSIGERLSGVDLQRPMGSFVEMAAYDYDLLPLIMSMQESQDDYLFDHCVNVAMLSIGIAQQLGLSHGQITEIGLGAMLQDVGMLRVPTSIRLSANPLTPEERFEIDRHPLHTVEMLEALRGIPRTVKLIAYQVHERQDGSGYPRNRVAAQIHQYARIVSAADTYAAMTRARPHRPAFLPYEAARAVLVGASDNKFDRTAVRALLDTVSLFPIGSLVELGDGVRATVLRANPGQHTRPVIETVDKSGSPTGQIIDLSKDTSLKVVRASGKDETRIEAAAVA